MNSFMLSLNKGVEMKEYGGYFELDRYRLPMIHEDAIALNCGRNCLAYLIKARKIKKLCLPYFMCDCVFDTAKKYGVELTFYHINENLRPEKLEVPEGAWLYVMNYYGQLTADYIAELKAEYSCIIVDNAQAYFDMPLKGTDTLYTCRKFFGVADGAILYTDAKLGEKLHLDESFERMHFVLGRFERTASEFYTESAENNDFFENEPVKKMSKLTYNLLHGIDYEFVKKRRTENYNRYHEKLGKLNQLSLREAEGAFVYPLLIENGAAIRKALQQKKIYIPTLWPNVINEMPKDSIEYKMAMDILPLPCDQRYDTSDMEYLILHIGELLKNGGYYD